MALTVTKLDTAAYTIGQVDRAEGVSLRKNPYDAKTSEHKSWALGWKAEDAYLSPREQAATVAA